MVNFKKQISGVLAGMMLLAGIPAMASGEVVVDVLQYDDFNYNAAYDLNGREITGIKAATAADEARGFSSGLLDSTLTATTSTLKGWKLYSENGSYAPYSLKADKYNTPKLYRQVAENRQVKTNPGTDGENVYFITWEQYFDANALYNDGGCIEFVKDSTKAGMKVKDGSVYPYFRWGGSTEYFGETALTGGTTYNIVIKLEANSTENDKVSLMAYPKGGAVKESWDIEFEIGAGTSFSVFGINASTTTAGTSSDVRFADYRVERINGAASVAAFSDAQEAIAAIDAYAAAGEGNLSLLNYEAEKKIDSFGDTRVAEFLSDKLALALSKTDEAPAYLYAPEVVQAENFNYNASVDLNRRNLAGIGNPAAVGFSTGWVDAELTTKIPSSDTSWQIISMKGEGAPYYIKAGKHTKTSAYRAVADESKINTNPGTDNENIYYITWEQYIGDGVEMFETGIGIEFTVAAIKAGFNQQSGNVYPYIKWASNIYYGSSAVETGKTHKMVLKINANSTIADKISFMAYPKAEKAKTTWDIEFEISAGSVWTVLGLNNPTSTSGTSSDIRFANYCVELFSGAEDCKYFEDTEAAILSALSGETTEAEAQNMIDSLLDCEAKNVLQSMIDGTDSDIAALLANPTQEAYNAVQEALNKQPALAEGKAEKQAKLDIIAGDNGLTQFIVNADGIGENGKITATDKITVAVETANRALQDVFVVSYDGDGKLASVKAVAGESADDKKVTANVEVAVSDVSRVKVITLNSLSSFAPEIRAVEFVK